MKILGVSFAESISAACLIVNGEVVAATDEERFSRISGDTAFPDLAANFCLEKAGISAIELDAVAYYGKPLLRFEDFLMRHMADWPRTSGVFARDLQIWLGKNLKTRPEIRQHLAYEGPVYFCDRNQALAAAVFAESRFQEAAVAVLGRSAAFFQVHKGKLVPHSQISFPDSDEGFVHVEAAIAELGSPNLCVIVESEDHSILIDKLKKCPTAGQIFISRATAAQSAVIGTALWTEAVVSRQGLRACLNFGFVTGPEFSAEQFEKYLDRANIPHETLPLDSLRARADEIIAQGKSVAWFQGHEPRILSLGGEAPLRISGGPVACTPQDAFAIFAESGLDAIFFGPHLVRRESLPFLRAAT